METPLRGRSGGHAGTAPTVSFGQIVRKGVMDITPVFSFTDTHEKASAKSFESSLQMLETVNRHPRRARTAIALVQRLRPLLECVCVCVCYTFIWIDQIKRHKKTGRRKILLRCEGCLMV